MVRAVRLVAGSAPQQQFSARGDRLVNEHHREASPFRASTTVEAALRRERHSDTLTHVRTLSRS
jgi:hypothetical protein